MLTAIQNKKSSIAAGLFAALLLTCSPVVLADNSCATTTPTTIVPTTTKSDSYFTLTNAAWVTFFLMIARLWTREGDNSPVKYNLDELALFENVPNNLYYLVDDGIIGHFGKKPYLTVDMDNSRVEVALVDKTDENGNIIKDAQGNKIKVSTAVWPKGLMGWAAFYIKPLIAAAGVTVFIKTLLETQSALNAGTILDKDGKKITDFVNGFFTLMSNKYGKSIGKFTDYGTAPSVSAIGGSIAGLGLSK